LLNKETSDNLLQYYKKNDIKKVSLVEDSGILVITHNNNNNNNEIISLEQVENNSEIENIKNYLQMNNQKSLSLQQLEGFSSSPATPQTDYTPYLVGGISTFFCIVIVS
jgi:ribosomal 30S subunit maturation factor RimM